MRTEWRIAIGAAVVGAGIASYSYIASRPESIPPRPEVTGAAAVVEHFECYRCHDAPGVLVPAHRERSCVRCHQAVLAGELDDSYEAEAVAEWKQNIVHLTAVPSLTGIGERFRREWLVSFLLAPHDLRPELDATMPRLRLTPDEAAQIAAFFIPDDVAELPEERVGDILSGLGALPRSLRVERGRTLFVARDCARCHHYSGSVVSRPDGTKVEVRLAPDLRHTRDRMTDTALLRWLADPQAVKADTLMPSPALNEEELRDVAAYVLYAPLTDVTDERFFGVRLPILSRRVTHAEVDERVFHRICRHCHSDPAPAGGDGGPGNTGGYGFAARGVDFSSFEAMQRSPDLFAPDGETGVPLLVAAMSRRHQEVHGRVGERRGMPLGLPPMSLEEIQLVETWIAQGARP